MGNFPTAYNTADTVILIVDDEPRVRDSLSEILNLSGYSTLVAENVPEAINLIQAHPVKLILLDLKMPVENGHVLLKHLEKNKLNIYTLIVSIDASFTQACRTLRYDFVQEFIKKPYSIEGLLHSIKTVLEKIKLNEDNLKFRQQIRKSEQMHRFFVQNSPDIIYMLNDRGEFTFLNSAIQKILGYNRQELLGKHFSQIVHHEDKAKAQFSFYERRSGNRSTRAIELRLKRKKASQFQGEANIITIILSSEGIYKNTDKQKNFVGTYGVIRDINDRKFSENTIKKLNLAIENSPNLILITDKDGIIEYANQKITEISGYTIDEVIGQNTSILKSGETPDEQYKELWQTIKEGNTWRGILKNKKKNGDIYFSQLSIAPMHDANGTISHFITVQEDVTETLKLSEQLSYQATHDPLTDLINKGEFDRRLKRIIQTTNLNASEHVMCFMDLDQFKIVNDTCNHSAGDELLRQISKQISLVIRQRDTLARVGGDEFAILMEHCSIEQALKTTQKIHKIIEKFQFRWEGHCFRLGVSIGLVLINAENAIYETLLRQADMACYKAKGAGRNRTHIYDPTSQDSSNIIGEMSWLSRINHALKHNGFRLYRQKISALNSTDISHYEIFLRMTDKQGGLILPGAFLPAAERYQLTVKIDQWVIENIFSWFQQNPVDLANLDLCSINLSCSSLINEDMPQFIIDQMAQKTIPASKFCFEINEPSVVSNLSTVTRFIEQLKKSGFQFALDNFGSGLSSFAYLKQIPIDYLKIDGVYVKDMASEPVDMAMVKSINEIAHVMGIKTIAEFVEDDSTRDLLEKLKVDYAQGYCYGEPTPLSE